MKKHYKLAKDYFKFLVLNLSEGTIEFVVRFVALVTFFLCGCIGIFVIGKMPSKSIEVIGKFVARGGIIFILSALTAIVLFIIFDFARTTVRYIRYLRSKRVEDD